MRNGAVVFLLVFLSPLTSLGHPQIPLDSAWKRATYEFSRKNLVHPSWGLAHAERNYLLTKELAAKEGLPLDEEALFAASFLHDLGGMPGFAEAGKDHALKSAELAEPLLRDWGFPMAKWPEVKDIILGHVYYGPAPASPVARAFRDADILDFLGAIGVARILAVTQEPGFANGTLKPTVRMLRSFADSLPGKGSLPEAKRLGAERGAEMASFLRALDEQTFGGTAL